MMDFTFQTPPTIHFGWGSRARLPAEVARFGKRLWLCCGRSLRATGALPPIVDALERAGIRVTTFEGVPPEPDLDVLQRAMDAVGEADVVAGIGGGSVLDIAKAAAALAGTGASAVDYFAGRPVPASGRPILLLPTTSGTGSEVTWVTVLVDHANRRKASIRGPGMMPAVAIVDPELTVSCPAGVTAASGMDAFVQAVESYTSNGANPMTDALAFQAALLTAGALERAVAEPASREAREAMALGSMLAGMALNTSRLGLVHGLAHPLGAVTGAAHGLLCGLLMPPVMRFNRVVSGPRYARLAVGLRLVEPGGEEAVAVDALIKHVESMLHRFNIPPLLRGVGFRREDREWVAQETMPSGSTRANPRSVSVADALAVLDGCS